MQRVLRTYLSLCACVFVLLPPSPTVAQPTGRAVVVEPTRGQRWAVVVGVNQYTELNDLNFCVADARTLRDRLVAAGFPKDNVFLLVDGADQQVAQPFRANISQRIKSVLAVAGKDDLVLVSFSGHGVHLDGKSYFCPTEASLNNPQTTMVPLESIYKQLETSPARQKLLLVDACRNDPRRPGSRDAGTHQISLKGLADDMKALSDAEGILSLSSAAAGQISWEDEKLGHGVFMHYVMNGLSGQADANRDGAVSLLELYAYANLETKRYVLHNRPGYEQTPELLGKITGDFELGTRPAPPLAVAPFSATAARGHQQAWAKYLGQPIELTNNGMKLTLIPPGEFVMGSTVSAEEIDRRFPGGKVEWYTPEHPHHAVRLTRPFYLGTHEVTVADFQRFVTATGHKTTAEKEGKAWGYKSDGTYGEVDGLTWLKPGFEQQDTHPVTCVSWDDATAFCQWLSGQDDRTYRLPTEAEWEYASRGGTDTVFFWGDDADGGEGYLNAADLTGLPDGRQWTYKFNFKDGYAATSPVGRFKPNAFGLYDVLGNVNEWCSDWYGSGYYGESPVDDPTGPTAGSDRVFRGGSWSFGARDCRSAYRDGNTPGYRSRYLGFRVALSSVDAAGR